MLTMEKKKKSKSQIAALFRHLHNYSAAAN